MKLEIITKNQPFNNDTDNTYNTYNTYNNDEHHNTYKNNNTHLLTTIQQQIQAKRQLLLKKQKMLKKKASQNEFLSQIRDDYSKYYNYIIEQKRQQMLSMQMLQHYIDDMIVSEKLTDQDLNNAKKEQGYIINHLKSVKHSLDEIVRETSS